MVGVSWQTPLANVVALAVAICALYAAGQLRPFRWIWKQLVKDPIDAWHKAPTEALAKEMRDGRDAINKRVGVVEDKVSGIETKVDDGFKDIAEQLTKHDERVTRSQTPRRATDPSDVSWEDARGEFPS